MVVLICTPRHVISKQGGVSLSGDVCKPSSEKMLFMHVEAVCDSSGVAAP